MTPNEKAAELKEEALKLYDAYMDKVELKCRECLNLDKLKEHPFGPHFLRSVLRELENRDYDLHSSFTFAKGGESYMLDDIMERDLKKRLGFKEEEEQE